MELKTYFAQDRNGSLIPAATVAIYLTGTNILASGLTTVSNTPLSNPFSADADGKIQFHAPDGIYDMQVSQGSTTGVRVTFQCVDVEQQLADANSAADRAEAAAESIEDEAVSIMTNTREQWRRSLADAGINLVDGSFEEGATVHNANDSVWYISGGQCYLWEGSLPKTVNENSTPESSGGISTGAWVAVSHELLRSQLMEDGNPFVSPTRIKAPQSGNIAQCIYYVTPEQFGAVGDGTLHKLSEFYSTLALAQAVYPFVTDINQSVDWAAMQAADNFARGKMSVRCPARSKYYFSSLDTLMLGIDSVFIGGPQSDHFQGTRILKDKPAATPTTNIGDICIVKVKSATAAGSSDQFVRGVVFKGFSLEWANVAWMSAVKGDLSVCFHANEAIKAKIDISVWGGEWGVYGYGCWGMVGTLRVLSCHKGVYFDPVASTPEHPTSSGSTGSTTSFDLRVEIGGCPFPIYLDKCQYSRFTGYVEVLNSTEGAIWDSANETPVAIQLGRECAGLTFDLAVEFYNGLLLLADKDNKNINTNWEFIYTYTYNNASGPHTARYAIANKYAQTEVTIPSSSRAIFSFNDIGNDVTVNGMNMQPTSTSFNNLEAEDKYLYASLSGNRLFFNGGNVQCTSYLKVTSANKRVIDFYRNNGLADALKPGAGWFYLGGGMYEQSAWTTAPLDANGVVWVGAPAGFNLHKCQAYSVGGGGLSHGLGVLEVPTATLMKFILPGGNATRSIVHKSTVELLN